MVRPLLFILLLTLNTACEARDVALLIGAGHFKRGAPWLKGPAQDVDAMRAALVDRLHFAPADVHVVKEGDATRSNVLAAIEALEVQSAPGDRILIYFSGHGISALASGYPLPIEQGTGAFLPIDAFDRGDAHFLDQLILGARDLQPRIEALEQGHRQITVFSDTCYSGQMVRSAVGPIADGLTPRIIDPSKLFHSSIGKLLQDMVGFEDRQGAKPYPYAATAFLSAAAEGETANSYETEPSELTLDRQAHGTFTDALLRILGGQLPADFNGDGQIDLIELQQAITSWLAKHGVPQTPQRLPSVAEDRAGLAHRPVFSLPTSSSERSQEMPLPTLWIDPTLAPSLQHALQVVNAEVARTNNPNAADLLLGPLRTSLPGFTARQASATLSSSADAGSDVTGRLGLYTPSGDLLGAISAQNVESLLVPRLRQFGLLHRLLAEAQIRRSGVLETELTPARFGGNFFIGAEIGVVVKPQHDSVVVLLAFDPDGTVSVLYPRQHPDELLPLAGGHAHAIPSNALADPITAVAPAGTEILLAFAYGHPPAGLAAIAGMQSMAAGDPRLRLLEQTLLAHDTGPLEFRRLDLRIFDRSNEASTH